LEIRRMTNRDDVFYQLMGPYLARREVEKEIGFPIYDEDGKEWFVAIDDGAVVGFCYRFKGHIGSCYVVEERRRQGLFRQLLKAAMKDATGTIAIRTKSEIMKALLEKEGFASVGNRGSFIEYRKEMPS